MLKGSLPPYLDARNEDNSFYMTLSNGPPTYVAESTNTEPENCNHNLENVYFITPILCKHCEDYIWGSGKVGVACKVNLVTRIESVRLVIGFDSTEDGKEAAP
ncbi:hypothetical protein M0802_000523 [Mischocyttarus mexicanus]|nr:hypothetical protein M0802_000523 [Mischocyttarus mexicanus]